MDKQFTTIQVANLFNSIAKTYDFLNHFLSGGLDYYWRRKAIKFLGSPAPARVLDIACGTGDFSIAAAKWGCKSIIGVDISENMLSIAMNKILKQDLQSTIKFQKSDAENLPFESSMFDASIVAFGVRNFHNLDKGLSEIYRVLIPKGKIVILEFSIPKNIFFRTIYLFYFKHILPFLGKMISKNNYAYNYLPNTVLKFPEGENFRIVLEKIGFIDTYYKTLTLGIVTIYTGIKK